MIKVLFVCMGNICRSPMAEAIFQHMVNQAGLEAEFYVDSAGTGGWHVGEQAHPGTLDVLERHDIPYDGRARQLERRDLDDFDYVLAMDRANLSFILRNSSNFPAEVSLFLTFAQERGLVNINEVPDPYYDNKFDDTYELSHTRLRCPTGSHPARRKRLAPLLSIFSPLIEQFVQRRG